MKKHVNLTISGRVQGVGFRYATQRSANLMGIKGFVQNNVNGSVSVEAEGEEEILNQFLEWCHQGPGWARIDRVSQSESNMIGYKEFTIR